MGNQSIVSIAYNILSLGNEEVTTTLLREDGESIEVIYLKTKYI